MPIIRIDDPQDPRLEDYRIVSDAELLRARQRFIAEGRLVVRRLLTSSALSACSLLVTKPALDSLWDLVPGLDPGLPIYVISQVAMNATVGFNIHRGCLAAGQRPPVLGLEMLGAIDSRHVVVLEQVSNADNVGGIFRSAAALGGDAVVLGPHCCDPLYRKAIRTSIGATLEMPFVPGEPWPDALGVLRDRGFRVVACTPEQSASAIDEAAPELARVPRVALLFGAEGDGLSAEALRAATDRVRIPMRAGVDSLNVTVAAGIAMHRLWSSAYRPGIGTSA